MTDFSSKIAELASLPSATVDALVALRDDEEILETVTKSLYPRWTAGPDGEIDQQLEDGRHTWHGIVDELSGARAA